MEQVCELVHGKAGRALLVGGYVRDAALGRSPVDLDIEVYGIQPDALIALLEGRFSLDLVGRAFGVIKLRGLAIDVSLPRSESKAGLGHRGFEVLSDPFMTFQDAARRRDFTVNAIAYDPLQKELIDPYNGMSDLKEGTLRHTSEKFSEDPLRVLRAMQFVARYEFEVAAETLDLCRQIEPEGLPKERIFGEWRKLLERGTKPSLGLAFLRDCGWLQYFPELETLVGCAQDTKWHPEGDVWVHTLHALDVFAEERIGDAREDLIVGLAVLCHDLGKPLVAEEPRNLEREGQISAIGHEQAGEAPSRSLLERMTEEKEVFEQVLPLVRSHLAPRQLYLGKAGDGAVRRLASRVERIDRLVRVARADQFGRPPLPKDEFLPGEWLLERAQALAVTDKAPPAIVLGRHLKELGLEPGPAFGPVLASCYEAQLDGKFFSLEEGVALAKRLIAQSEALDDEASDLEERDSTN
ncbi:MAG: HD domain-containing protein [Deltaproteobacteria bacterium]|nr:HD domain-containing protein [Deltaproteobacteria bacterium]